MYTLRPRTSRIEPQALNNVRNNVYEHQIGTESSESNVSNDQSEADSDKGSCALNSSEISSLDSTLEGKPLRLQQIRDLSHRLRWPISKYKGENGFMWRTNFGVKLLQGVHSIPDFEIPEFPNIPRGF
ncbi:hypothetical protein QAD02_003700 [Eretmocerus hayati]|uniref:Uncharacterized protein n=1 Tax=Eretmocerus hayati TaxID=131215 RepID=A0ACC2NMT7_9HYME|nr:hypothetical protein QAD02_003700 [Eretmocerus hayati]